MSLVFFLPQCFLFFPFAALRRILQRQWTIPERCVGEERLQPVIVLLQDRIVFVIVAARAAESQAQKSSSGYRRNVVIGNLIRRCDRNFGKCSRSSSALDTETRFIPRIIRPLNRKFGARFYAKKQSPQRQKGNQKALEGHHGEVCSTD